MGMGALLIYNDLLLCRDAGSIVGPMDRGYLYVTTGTGWPLDVKAGKGTAGYGGGNLTLKGGENNGGAAAGRIIIGPSNTSAVDIGAAGLTTTITGQLTVSSGTGYGLTVTGVTNGGKVGFGTASPTSALHIVDATGSGTPAVDIYKSPGSLQAGAGASITMSANTSSPALDVTSSGTGALANFNSVFGGQAITTNGLITQTVGTSSVTAHTISMSGTGAALMSLSTTNPSNTADGVNINMGAGGNALVVYQGGSYYAASFTKGGLGAGTAVNLGHAGIGTALYVSQSGTGLALETAGSVTITGTLTVNGVVIGGLGLPIFLAAGNFMP
jgi:hypothetical protein